MVEPPGTAPGSDPFITSAFMSIVPKDRNNIGQRAWHLKGEFPVKPNHLTGVWDRAWQRETPQQFSPRWKTVHRCGRIHYPAVKFGKAAMF